MLMDEVHVCAGGLGRLLVIRRLTRGSDSLGGRPAHFWAVGWRFRAILGELPILGRGAWAGPRGRMRIRFLYACARVSTALERPSAARGGEF